MATTPGRASRPSVLPAFGDDGDQLVAVDRHGPVRRRSRRDRHRHPARCRCRRASRAPWRDSASGAVEPQSLLMLKPSGSTPIGITSAPVSTAPRAPPGRRRRWRSRRRSAGRRAQVSRQGALGELDVALLDALERLARPSMAVGDQLVDAVSIRLDLALDLVGQLVAVRAEQLDAVVIVGVVRGGDHHAEVGAHRARQHRHRRRRHRAEQQHVHAHRVKPATSAVSIM